MVGNGIKAKVAAAIAQDEGGHAQRHPSDQVEEMHVEVQQVVSDEQPHRHRAYCQREYPAGSPQHMVGKGEKAIDRKSVVSGKSVSVRVDLGGRRIIKKKKIKKRKSK